MPHVAHLPKPVSDSAIVKHPGEEPDSCQPPDGKHDLQCDNYEVLVLTSQAAQLTGAGMHSEVTTHVFAADAWGSFTTCRHE